MKKSFVYLFSFLLLGVTSCTDVRGRQYGKTTTIGRLEKRFSSNYICASISFQYSNDKMFADETGFCQGLLSRIRRSLLVEYKDEAKLWLDENVADFEQLDFFISERCIGKKNCLNHRRIRRSI
jgi:hypothetical protein